jgi:hypothetical protein
MWLRFLGKHSSPGSSPTLWDTDENRYVIQGFELGTEALAQVGEIPAGEAVIWVPKELMRHLPEVRRRVFRRRSRPSH